MGLFAPFFRNSKKNNDPNKSRIDSEKNLISEEPESTDPSSKEAENSSKDNKSTKTNSINWSAYYDVEPKGAKQNFVKTPDLDSEIQKSINNDSFKAPVIQGTTISRPSIEKETATQNRENDAVSSQNNQNLIDKTQPAHSVHEDDAHGLKIKSEAIPVPSSHSISEQDHIADPIISSKDQSAVDSFESAQQIDTSTLRSSEGLVKDEQSNADNADKFINSETQLPTPPEKNFPNETAPELQSVLPHITLDPTDQVPKKHSHHFSEIIEPIEPISKNQLNSLDNNVAKDQSSELGWREIDYTDPNNLKEPVQSVPSPYANSPQDASYTEQFSGINTNRNMSTSGLLESQTEDTKHPTDSIVTNSEELTEVTEVKKDLVDQVYSQRLDHLTQKLSVMHNGITTMSPMELTTPGEHLPKKVLIVGHCYAEDWYFHKTNLTKTPTDFILVNNLTELPLKSNDEIGTYDFQVIQFPLRFVLSDSALWGGVRKSSDQLEEIFQNSLSKLKSMFELYMQYNAQCGLLTFVTNFMVPSFNPLGKLLPYYSLANPQYFIDRLNQELEKIVFDRESSFILNVNSITANLGKRFIQEDYLNLISHGALMPGNLKDTGRIEHAPPLKDHYVKLDADFRHFLWIEILSAFRITNPIAQVKLLVIDLDDTLWNGVVGEMGSPDVSITEGWPAGVLEALSYFKDRGVLLAILSKNRKELVEKVWHQLYENRFPLANFISVKCSFDPKSELMREILQETNLTPQSVLFIDDNPLERAEIQSVFPGVRVMHGYHYYWRKIVLLAAETQVPSVTKESLQRTEMLKVQIDRTKALKSSESRDEFLVNLQLRTVIARLKNSDPKAVERCFELINKTNQFNTTGKRWSRSEFLSFLIVNKILFFTVEDQHTSYGIVGLLLLKGNTIEQFVMSCRVVGLTIEIGVLSALVKYLVQQKLVNELFAHLVTNESNNLCQEVYKTLGFVENNLNWKLNLANFQSSKFFGNYKISIE